MLISEKPEDVGRFYDAVVQAIEKGELDAQILALHQGRSKALKAAHAVGKGAWQWPSHSIPSPMPNA
jgi:hypothetical protein